MFEGVVATILNRYLGKYIQDLDTENLNVGIFSGDVQLTELRLKPEALYELDVPIEVKVGTIGRICLSIPWTGLYTQSVTVSVEDVYVIAGPVVDRPYDPEKEKRLIRAAKKKKLEDLEGESLLSTGPGDAKTFLENLVTTVINNLQIYIRNIHIRYEDTVTNPDCSFACGMCIQSISVETTNNKWKPSITPQGASSLYQLVRMESFSVYWNPSCGASGLVTDLIGPGSAPYCWRNEMRRGLETFSINKDDFDFIVKPITAKMKIIVNKSNEARVPKLLADFVLQDAATQLSRQQFLSIIGLTESFQRMSINRNFRQFHPGVSVSNNTRKWWKYAYDSVLEQRVRPYTWQHIKSHREHYRKYKNTYKKTLLSPNDTELRLDLQLLEDQLAIIDIVVAREHAKIELYHEDPEHILVHENEAKWWDILVQEKSVEMQVRTEKERGLWAQLSLAEKKKLCEAIGYVEGAARPHKPKQYTEHKFNFTLANCSLSLVNHRREVLVVTLTQFLASLETRPSAQAFKVSARAESFVVEGASVENDLIPMVTADNILSGNTSSNFLAVDFEKHPLNCEADFGLGVSLEPVEIVYHEHAVSEIINFFQTRSVTLQDAMDFSKQGISKASEVGRALVEYAIARRKTIDINMDLKGPYFVVPELGSVQKGGSIVVVDFGRVVIKSDLQSENVGLEDATQMELEERLYDRLHIDFSDLQLLFCDSGEEWRDARKLQDTDYHLVPKIRCQVVFSNSVKPEYRLLPRHKLNFSISSLKLNLSDRKIGMVLDFLDNLPLPSPNTLRVSEVDSVLEREVAADKNMARLIITDRIMPEFSSTQLLQIKKTVVMAEMSRQEKKNEHFDKSAAKLAMLEVEKSFISSDHSDEENELWARTVDLPGFDDNVSPQNIITMLLRLIVGEVVLQLARSNNRVDKPYLMLQVSKVCWDMAVMEYGPAVQASIGGIHLIDKIHTGCSGEYLELISTDNAADMITLLYRKVQANCPDFKSHFHSVEQSLVLDFTSLSVVFHREAFSTLNKYLQYLLQKIQTRETHLRPLVHGSPTMMTWLFSGEADPPIPPGATKFSYSTRLGDIRVRLCDTDVDFLEVKVAGLESDCLFKANERMVLRIYLTTLAVDDLSDMTLYPKILTIEEDKVFDFKYVRHSPKLYTQSDLGPNKDDVKSDGSLRLHIGRIHVVLLYKLLVNLQHYMEPFIHPGVPAYVINAAEKSAEQQIVQLRGWSTRLHLSLDLHAPTLLLPQKSSSPNLIVLNMGDLSVENFFKEMTRSHFPYVTSGSSSSVSASEVPVVDNVLVRLESVQVSRAVMTLAGSLEIQEPILEPMSIRLDVKRMVAYHHTMNSLPPAPGPYLQLHRDLLLYEIDGGMENVRINIGQRDLATLLSVWSDNLAEDRFMDMQPNSDSTSPIEPRTPINPAEDSTVKKLQAFFCQTEHVRRESSIHLTLDGLQLYLFNDMDEVLSSPVRDLNHGLCKLDIGEAALSLDTFTDHSLELKMALQSCLMEDIRPHDNIIIKKIFQSHSGEMKMDSSPISVSTPPIIDVTFKQTQSGDRCIDVLVEKIRLNLSVPFFINLGRFLMDSLPGEHPTDGGVVNHGYVGDLGVQNKAPVETLKPVPQRPPSSADSTSGYFSSGASYVDDLAGLSVSVQLRKPEIMLFADLSEHSGHALLLRTEFLVDYSRHPGRDSLVCSLAGLQILSKLQGHNKQPPHLVLHPCDIEFVKSLKSVEDGLKVSATVSTVNIHLSASTVHTVSNVIEDILNSLQAEETELPTKMGHNITDLEDIWSPKKIQPYIFPETCETLLYGQPSYPEGRPRETFTVAVPKIRVVFELEGGNHRIPVLLFKSSVEASIKDWSKQMHMKAEIQMQASYYNDRVGAWEPLIEPCVEEENVYRPWEVLVKVFHAKAFPISSRLDHDMETETDHSRVKIEHRTQDRKAEESETSADETEPENGMTFIRRHNVESLLALKRNANENVSLIGYPDDSDSENEEGVLEKLAGAIGHLFTGDSSDGEGSESEDSSGAEPSVETEEASEITMSCGSTVIGKDERAIFLKKQNDSIDSGLETEAPDRLATYIMMDARDQLNITLTPAGMQVLHDLAIAFTHSIPDIPSAAFHGLEAPLSLQNDLGPWAKITLLSRAEISPDGKDRIVMTALYNKSDSLPSSPASTTTGLADFSPPDSDTDIESFEGGFNTQSSEGTTGQELFSPLLRFPGESVTKLYKKVTDERLIIDVEGFDRLQVVAPQRLVSKLHMLHPMKNNTRYYAVVSVDTHHFHRKILVRSPLQVKNETSYAMGLYYKKSMLDALGVEHVGESTNPFEDTIRVAIVEPDETFSVPLYVAYHCKLFILPAYVDSYHVSEIGLWWQELASDLNTPKDIYCTPKEEKDATVFSVRALCVEGAPMNRASRSIPNYMIRLLPPLAIHNRLPYAVEVRVPTIKYEVRIEAGEKTNVYFLNLLKMHKICVEVPFYLGIPWMGSFNMTADLEEKTVAMVTEYDTEGGNKQLGLNLHVERTETCDVFLHAPYWIINKTGLPLQIRASLSDVVYEAQGEEPLLFCYKKHRRHCVRLRAYHSSWSSAFSLDTVSCTGLVVCKDRERKRRYRILLSVILSKLCPHLTRIVTLLPNFLVVNDTRKHLRFMEENERADLWIDLASGQCIPFWPDTDSMRMYVKFRDSKLVSQHFPITHIHQTVLRMDKGQAGLCVDVSGGGDQPFTVTFRSYCLGDAPVRVDNLCEDLFLKIHQQDLGQVALLSPYQSMLYTWDDPSKERLLLWNVYNKKSKGIVAEFWKDGYGQERVSFHTVKQPCLVTSMPTVTAKLSASLKRMSSKSPVRDGSSSSDDTESDEQKPQQLKKTRKDKVTVYWVSYLEGPQRVLLFTQDERIAYQARSNIDAEKSNLEMFLSFSGIGVSLALESNYCQKELAYISISDSSPVWEVMVAHRWKLLTLELASWIEDKWKQDQKKAQMKDYVHVDFEKMQMTKPFYGDLRRHYYPGLWLQYRKSDHQSYLHCKLHRIQVDNQLHDAVFPTVLYPTPIPRHIVRRVGMKPCIEMAVMKRHRPSQNQDVYKFIKVLVQEFSLQLDKGFLLSMYDILSNWQVEEKSSVRMRADIALVHVPLAMISAKAASEDPKVVIEYMHLSPLALQFSFSPRGTVYQKNRVRSFKSDLVDFFLNSFGATLTEVKGVKLKMAYLEQKGSLISLSQELEEIHRHYSSQLIQQFHVLVLGLDVLGNPYGLITDFTEGFGDFFYEPFLGVMEGPDEFAEGLSHGAQSLLGHVVGGTAGSVSLISSSLGDLLSSLSFDEDYKKKRWFCLQQASDLPDTILQASKTFVMGVALGLSGVIMKPIIGAQQEGVEGFFKGVGKGLMGLMTKPAGGVLDCIAMALDGIKRAAEMGEDVVMRSRLPRYMNPYTGLRPFSVYEATGLHLLNTLSKSHYSDSDIYWAHASLTKEAKVNVLISLQHVFLVEKCRLWGTWDVEWMVRVDDIMAVPHIVDNKLVFKVRQDESFNFFSGDERYIECQDTSVLEWLQNKIETVMILNMEDKPCPSEV
ncbi:vacuolar protein sorting-associated protein 13A-like isoform X4 [Zootermopsis nevadensis]|uniref:vacuolar protein sorting-associated protein 13A-like isoform X4 n=1 Tax=Zootermopsis nevadensis TaxID=136037 RepID=UPI000B8E3BF4|nr:vacuolar protein sorting-associated protein 13A-like isoform X4 [Zootermopsis nevadensis]